ncbi:MAG: isoleucine--tRNA ligase [Helicobacteraceae bacterium]|jgi:isoleucyl-tRNA synthetase|nr:isoleucine--tRNA ligase [Helicobacteraceae bacterium]
MDYKPTLFLPQTNFSMRANLTENEPKRYKKWLEENVYEQMKAKRINAPLFTLHDGPPYANGEIHIGHALNKILKDIIVKYHYFQGYAVRFTPGWDCHGLPIEQKVLEAALFRDKKELPPQSEIRRLCREHARKYVEIQKQGFISLGVVADWNRSYVTMDYKFEAEIYRELISVAKAGLLVERKKPVYWSWAAKSALAEAEVEYRDKESDSVYVAFKLDDQSARQLGIEAAKAVIWTTTLWTLPANVAIALKKGETYALTEDGYIAAASRLQALRESGVIAGGAIKTFNAAQLERLKAINPLNGSSSLLVLSNHVSIEDGTGLVHIAPGHGVDDYLVGIAYDLPILMSVDDGGYFDATVNPADLAGEHVFKASATIVEKLGEALLKHSTITHSYPHCWRTRKPVIFRATRQWFIAMDEPVSGGATLRAMAKAALESVRFYPESGRGRLHAMIETRPDWCISRQRVWGVPIAFIRHKATREVVLDDRVLSNTAAIFEREGCDAWIDRPIEDFLGDGWAAEEYEKVTDILDVWFDSGSTQRAVLRSGDYDAGDTPADMYLEGNDQHRGWFQSSLLTSCAARGEAPFKSIVTHGFTVDEQGGKMSKSLGNVIAPSNITNKMGSEILRLWVAMSDYSADIKISQNILSQISDQYKKLRNTFRFMLANIDDLKEPISLEELKGADRWIAALAAEVFGEAEASFKAFDFARAFHRVNSFVVSELSGVYLDMVKDRIYCDPLDSPRRIGAQSAIYHIARTLLTLVAPVLTYTADEVMAFAPKLLKAEGGSIFDLTHRSLKPVGAAIDGRKLLALREAFFERVDALKKQGAIKNTLELGAICAEDFGLEGDDLADWLTISFAQKGAKPLDAMIELEGVWIVKSGFSRCPRCWKFVSHGEDELCDRCRSAIL